MIVGTRNLICAVLTVAALSWTSDGQAQETKGDFYVSATGDDVNPGTLDKPFRTLARARDAVRELKAEKCDHPVRVLIRGGTYGLEQSIVFSGRDSGTAECPITYSAYPGERPVFRGGRTITGWKPHGDQIFVAQLPQTENQYWRVRELFFNGQRQVRARYPNFDPSDPQFGGWAFVEATVPADANAPVCFQWEPGVFPRQWAKPQQGEIFIIPGLAWNSHIIPIRDCDPDKRLITVTRRLTQNWDRLMKGNRFYVENLLEELDEPGEWCFDTDTQKLYFWPPEGALDGAEVTVPVIDRLIELRATTSESVRHLRFVGLTFTQSLPVFPFIHPLHPDYVDCNRPNSGGYAFYMENTEHCAVENCTFNQVGGDAIRLHGSSFRNRIVENEIAGAGAQGVCIAYLDFWPYDFPPVWRGQQERMRSVSSRLPWAVGNVISRNHIHHCGVIDNFGAAIHLHALNTDGNVISHNRIHDQPHHAVYLSMGFGRNTIEYNDIYALCRVMADAGGVYCNRWSILENDPVLSQGLVIQHNRIRDVMGVNPHGRSSDNPAATPSQDRLERPYFTWGIYFDNSPRRAIVYGNLCIDNVWGGAFLGGGYAEPEDCVVENNIFVDSTVYQFDVAMNENARGNRFARNIVYFQNPDAALLRASFTKGLKECDHNVYFLVGGQPLKIAGLPGETWDKWRELGFDRNSLIADPLFVDPARGDYRLKPDSPALKLGFQPIPFEQIGLNATAELSAALGNQVVTDNSEPEPLAAMRKKAVERKRRLIYNDDGCGPIMQAGGDTPEGFLNGPNSRMRPLPGTQVDSVFICSGATHVLNHASSVAESYADVVDRYKIGGEWVLFRDNMRSLENRGTDVIQLTIDFCRKHQLEVVYSHRINDIHNTFLEVERSTWFREHPDYWLGTPGEAAKAGGGNSPKHWWSALDFEKPAVLDYLCRIQEEVCSRYDVDGVEIDYFRSPMFFRPNLDFQPATPGQLEILTGFQRRLRAVHLHAGTKRGRPILTIARVPATPAACRHVGIDVEQWLKEGLVDVLTVGGGYVPFTEPLDEIVNLAHAAGVPVYTTISASGMRGPENRYSSHEAWRGAAANMWRAGVDGIVTFNLFPNGPEPRFADIGSPETLAGRNKLFVIDSTRVLEGDLVQGVTQGQTLPVAIPGDGKPATAVLPIGDDLPAAGKNGTLASAELRIQLRDLQAVDAVELRLNGAPLTPTQQDPESGWLVFSPQAEQYRVGRNELTFRATAGAPSAERLAEVIHVEVPVVYKDTQP
ncbi:MAG: hypothetical protein A2V98_23040 [Planctomycetes bacterium RBG_16_64_12]|nr:MAG: hypothetical protein A2V98_23040 [Planctomycetes bacterium RBG_16_64_12]